MDVPVVEPINLKIVFILAIGFAFASILGYLTYRAKLSPLLGYLIGGYLIGPFSPGYVADLNLAEQLAEIGVILMMFGVGLHFKWQDLLKVKGIAIPGAIFQIIIATAVCAWLTIAIGWSPITGVLFGLCISVASTVVLMRVLADNKLLETERGHIAVGWLIVEDVITVGILLFLPLLSSFSKGEELSYTTAFLNMGLIIGKFILLVGFMFTVGKWIVRFWITKVLGTESHELFTLTILALTFVIAAASSVIFGTSIALGAFIAGMVIGQTDIRHQVSINAEPLKDAFVVIFFLSVGMLFNPDIIYTHFLVFVVVLGVIMLVKPLTAFLITIVLRYPLKTALTIAVAMAQIGEFSFILAEEALKYKLIPDDAYDLVVACSIVSIAVNPLFFRLVR